MSGVLTQTCYRLKKKRPLTKQTSMSLEEMIGGGHQVAAGDYNLAAANIARLSPELLDFWVLSLRSMISLHSGNLSLARSPGQMLSP
ncbi:hypothetical protein SRHO_G00018470 [Serrasalmus rhombeus]